MPSQTDVFNEYQDILALYLRLQSVVQSYLKLVVTERNRFDKTHQEQLARDVHEKHDIDFDSNFSSYVYHIQSIRRCRATIARIDDSLFSMLNSFTDPFYNLMRKDTNVQPHCEATRNHARKTILYLDAAMNDNKLFQVYKVFDYLRILVTYFNNWIFVLDQIINDFGPTYDELLGRQ